MILSHPSDMLEDMHPWTGLSREDLEIDFPSISDCAALGHPFPKVTDFQVRECICGMFYLSRDGKRRATPDESDYRDPIDPRDWD